MAEEVTEINDATTEHANEGVEAVICHARCATGLKTPQPSGVVDGRWAGRHLPHSAELITQSVNAPCAKD